MAALAIIQMKRQRTIVLHITAAHARLTQIFLADTTGNKVALIIQIIIYILLAIVSLFGFVYVPVL